MRIGLAADTYKPYISGVTNYISLLKAELEHRGHEVVVFTFGAPGEILEESNVIMSPGFRLRMGFSFGFWYSKTARRRMEEMDLIHLHHPYLSGQLVLRAFEKKKPLIFTAHTRYDYYLEGILPRELTHFAKAFLRWYFPGFTRRMSRVICNSPASVEAMRNCNVDVRLDFVPNGIDLRPYQSAVKDKDWRKKMGDWPVQYLYTGRLGVEKNLPILLEAFAKVARRNSGVGLALVGGGPMENDLRELTKHLNLEDRITFMGAMAYECIPEILASADIFVTPSISECHPLVVIEAMAAGLAPVVAQSPAYLETIDDGKDGLVCAPSIEALAYGMEQLANDRELRERIGAAARLTAEKFSIEKTVDQIVEIYSEVLADWKHKASR